MVATIIEEASCSRHVPLLLIGKDEQNNAEFMKLGAAALGIDPPAIIYTNTITRYDGGKMGKSRAEYSLLVTNDVTLEVSKIEQFLSEHDDDTYCPICEIYQYSRYALLNLNFSSSVTHARISEVVRHECI